MEETTTTSAVDSKREQIIETLRTKSALLQHIFDNTQQVFGQLKEILQEYAVEVNEQLEGTTDKRVKMEYRDRGKFEAQLQMAGDILIFSMHTNVFQFERENIIWQNSYVKQDKQNAYCGIINIYN